MRPSTIALLILGSAASLSLFLATNSGTGIRRTASHAAPGAARAHPPRAAPAADAPTSTPAAPSPKRVAAAIPLAPGVRSAGLKPTDLQSLGNALASEDRSARQTAVRELAESGGNGARLLLARAYDDPRATPRERQTIRDALAQTRADREADSAVAPRPSGARPGRGPRRVR